MAGGVATMEQLTPEAYARLDALGERLRDGVRRLLRKQAATRARSPASARSSGCTTPRSGSATTAPAGPTDPQAPARTFMGLVNEGVLLTQRGLGACSLAMTDADVDRFVETLGRVLE